MRYQFIKRRLERKVDRYYQKQKTLIDHYDADADPDHISHQATRRVRLKTDLAIYWSAVTNFVIFLVQLVAAIKTKHLILAAGAADALMDLVCSLAMVAIARKARTPSGLDYPVGRTRTEPVGLLMFCCLAMNVGLQLIVSLET
jgi:divalent metal cation (Fe/Co/Zn/Cd) transporter